MHNDRFELLIGKENINKLQNCTVAVFGLGGVGSFALESLARSGVGTLIIVDFDVIDPTNINRQVLALNSTVGKKKTEVAAARIKDINPQCKVIEYPTFINKDSLPEILDHKIDGAIDAIDVLTSKWELIKQLQAKKIPFISSLGMGGRMDPTKVGVTTLDKTSYDPLARSLRSLIRKESGSMKFPVVYSSEQTANITGTNPEGNTRKEKHPIGSSIFVPATAGLVAGSYILKRIIDQK